MVHIGIEQEIVFKDGEGRYLDFSNTSYETFSQIIDALPAYAGDTRYFHPKSLETQPKRWYIEGFELHDDQGNVTTTVPKGIEIRTTPHNEIETLVAEFSESFHLLVAEAAKYGITPVLVSQHPFKTDFDLPDDLLETEKKHRSETAFFTACDAMFAHGLQINLSVSDEYDLDDIFEKIVYYFPFFLPYTFSSPFYGNALFEGVCARNYHRAESRIFTVKRQINATRYIEFKGFDACASRPLLSSVLTLLRALVLDTTLPERAKNQDPAMIRRASLFGFDDPLIKAVGAEILDAASHGLVDDKEEISRLREILETNRSHSAVIKERYLGGMSILQSVSDWYDYR